MIFKIFKKGCGGVREGAWYEGAVDVAFKNMNGGKRMKNVFKGKKAVAILLCTLILISMGTYGFANDEEIRTGKPKARAEVIEIKKLYDDDGDKLFENLSQEMEKAGDEEALPVTIVFKDEFDDAQRKKVETLLGDYKPKHEFKNIPAVSMNVNKQKIKELSKLDIIEHIEYDEEVTILNDRADYWFGTEKARSDFGLDGDRDKNVRSYSKDDVVVAVIDTGIDPNHVDLDGGKIIAWKDYVNERSTPYDDQGHGTHVAGTIAGEGDGNSKYEGVAKGAALIGLKTLNNRGSGSMSDITAAVDWCITNKNTYGINIINMSLGTTGSSNGKDSTSLAVNNAVANGITVVVAAGNSGPSRYTIGSPGAAEDAITVANMVDVGEGGFSLAPSSSRGPTADGRIKPDIGGPGTRIISARTNTINGYVTQSGTSMAAPFVAGTIALMLDANPNLTPNQIKSILTSTAQDWAGNGKDIDYGYGRLDAYKAIKRAGKFSGNNIELPNHMYASEDLPRKGSADDWEFTVTNKNYPISITLVMPDWKRSGPSVKPDFDLYLYDPSGKQVKASESSSRQENISFIPSTTGKYKIKVYSYSDSGKYFFDLSAGGSDLILIQDQ